ncbi:MAG: FG-GAP repeat protein [Rhodothermia bacterium]|nr:FG-GAP repeat protein [Rhodothermia bacterium]
MTTHKSVLVALLCSVFSTIAAAQTTIRIADLDGTNGFKLTGLDGGDRSGNGIASGDVNDDGIDDLIISAPYANLGQSLETGETYVVYGSRAGFAASFDLSSLDGSNGFLILSLDVQDRSEGRLSADVNGDGIDDIILGGTGGIGQLLRGVTYVVYGSSGGITTPFLLSALDGSNGLLIRGIDSQEGSSPSAVGDLNGDGVDDLLIGATGANPSGKIRAGRLYVVFGGPALGASVDLSALDGSNGFVIEGASADHMIGSRVAVGDINADGANDIVVAANSASAGSFFGAGKVFVFFGSAAGYDASYSLADLDGSNGFVLEGGSDNFTAGAAVASADLNDDGADDILIGANVTLETDTTYVVFGGQASWPATSVLSSSNPLVSSGIVGATVPGPAQQQLGMAFAIGDLNDDGTDDVSVGAPGFNGGAYTYSVFGQTPFPALLDVSLLDGSNGFASVSSGGTGHATRLATGDINGDGRDDVLIGAPLYPIDPFSTAGNNGGESYVVFSPVSGSVGYDEVVPGGDRVQLFQNAPNPFQQLTTIRFEAAKQGQVRLDVYDVLGRHVTTLVDDWRPAGLHAVDFSIRDLASGMLYYRLTTGQETVTRMMTKIQ